MAGLYIHIPFCESKCAYCDFVSFPGREKDFSAYVDYLIREAELRAPLPAFDTVFVGGGTPSALPPDAIPRVLDALSAHIRAGAEITCEANPKSLTARHIAAWRDAGVNRLSLGAQAMQPRLLALLGRVHAWEDVIEAAALWGDPDHLSLDLMHSLPTQTPADWEETLAAAAALGPAHLSCYALIVEEDTPMYRRIERGELVQPDSDAYDPQAAATEILRAYGYARYEISNYAKDGRVCRHNMNYWLRGDYVGLGCAAHSFLDAVRIENDANLNGYMDNIRHGRPAFVSSQVISESEAWIEEIMLGLRLTGGIELSPGAYNRYREGIQKMESLGMLEKDRSVIRLTPRGMDVMNAVLLFLEG